MFNVNGFNVDELSNVAISIISEIYNNDDMFYNVTPGMWEGLWGCYYGEYDEVDGRRRLGGVIKALSYYGYDVSKMV